MIPETPAELVEFMLSWLPKSEALEIVELRLQEGKIDNEERIFFEQVKQLLQ